MRFLIAAATVLAISCAGTSRGPKQPVPSAESPRAPEAQPRELVEDNPEVDRLITRLFVEDFAVRARAAEELGAHGPRARIAVPYLVSCVISEGEPSEQCAVSLGLIGPGALPALGRLAASPATRSLALTGLAAMDDPEAERVALACADGCSSATL